VCGISKALAYDYARLGEDFSTEIPGLTFYQVDVTVEKKTAEHFGILNFPKIVFVVDKLPLHYTMEYTRTRLGKWIKEKLSSNYLFYWKCICLL